MLTVAHCRSGIVANYTIASSYGLVEPPIMRDGLGRCPAVGKKLASRIVEYHRIAPGDVLHQCIGKTWAMTEARGKPDLPAGLIYEAGTGTIQRFCPGGYRFKPSQGVGELFRFPNVILVSKCIVGRLKARVPRQGKKISGIAFTRTTPQLDSPWNVAALKGLEDIPSTIPRAIIGDHQTPASVALPLDGCQLLLQKIRALVRTHQNDHFGRR